MSELIPYAVHYLLDGVRQHFFKLAVKFSEVDAIHSAYAHAFPQHEFQLTAHSSLETARVEARQLGITQIRWNEAV
ncbi:MULTISPECIES: hypothetical protein [Pseudomonas]|uniref:hypothetical protein n=1 Tax=Pseudomonas sp. MIL9 TaxID=2807620 RepID=UPI0010299ECC|nr:hypothetical protein [Pseudomonas sp. MIL9]MBM6442176.1 hypothetical protein [Pseudomonas sp. MIL9]RZO09500.1 hypothetical protein EKG40_08625 [Pseudomonas moorei]